MLRNRVVPSLLVGFAGLSCAVAAPLDTRLVAPNAAWFAHIDIEAAHASALGKWILAHQKDFDLEEGLEEFREETGIDPLKDLFSVTVYGHSMDGGEDEDNRDDAQNIEVFGEDDTVIVLLVSDTVQEQAERLAKEEEGLDRIVKGDLTMYRWDDGGDEMLASFLPGTAPDKRVMIAASSRELLKAGLEVAKAKSGPTKAAGGAPKAGSIVYFSMNDVGGKIGHHAEAEMFKMAKAGQADIGEAGGELFADLQVAAGTEQEANDMAQVVSGLMAMGRMMFGDEPDMKPLMELANSLTPEVNGKTISMRLRFPSDKAIQMLEAMRDEAHGHHDADDDDHDDDKGDKGEKGVKGDKGEKKPKGDA